MADDEALRVSSSGSPPWLVIAGEIDESTFPILLNGLATAEGDREIRIDLGGVRYCDLAGLRRIVRLTGPSSARRPPDSARGTARGALMACRDPPDPGLGHDPRDRHQGITP